MKRFLYFFLAVFLAMALILPAYAADSGEGENSGSSPVVLVPDVNVFNEVIVSDDPGDYLDSTISTQSSYAAIGSDLKSILLRFLGDYETIIVEHSYQASDGTINTVHESLPDVPWICSAALLCLMIFCLFRLGGSILCKT